ncbi:MAG: hypothetical protein WDO13_19250 [Verrucomicrobiota bacterium]
MPWENDKWMWHVKAASFGRRRSHHHPKTGTTTNFASAGAALDATPGSFYTDGTTLYIHPSATPTRPATAKSIRAPSTATRARRSPSPPATTAPSASTSARRRWSTATTATSAPIASRTAPTTAPG